YSAFLGRTAAVVRHWRHIRNAGDLEADRIQRANGRFTTGARALDAHFEVLHAAFLRGLACSLGCNLSGERRALARTLEAGAAGRGPRQGIALAIGDRDDGVVERSMDVGNTLGNVLLDLLAYAYVSFSHVALFLQYCYLDALIGRIGPLRVRALVAVR